MPGIHHGLGFRCAKVDLSPFLAVREVGMGWTGERIAWALVSDGFPLKVMLE